MDNRQTQPFDETRDAKRDPRAVHTVHYDGALGHTVDECAARGCETAGPSASRAGLIRNEAHVALDRIIRRRQGQAREDIHNLLLRVRIFGDVLVEAYGRDINRLELIEALEKEFCQGLRDIR